MLLCCVGLVQVIIAMDESYKRPMPFQQFLRRLPDWDFQALSVPPEDLHPGFVRDSIHVFHLHRAIS